MSATGIKPKFSIEKAHETQLRLSKQIVFEDVLPKRIRFVAGVDVAYVKDLSIGAVAVLDYISLKLVESHIALCKTRFPYIPTLLSFREIPPTVLSVKKLHVQPDVFLVDGHGFAHPYRCGFASHLGLVVRKPTIGVAKSRLFGEVEDAGGKEDAALLKHNNEVIGAVVTTKRGCKPIYVSVGHMVSLETAIKIVKHCARYNRIPEPILKAHEIATAEKRKINIASTVNR
ncbi:MAG: deoxyribonuclease V [Candidatus Bathyarchaeales archaeon]